MKKPEKLTGSGDSLNEPFCFGKLCGFNLACNDYEKYHNEVLEQERYNCQMKIEKLEQRLNEGRDYLMGVRPNQLTVEDALEAFDFGRNGLKTE